MDNAKFCHRLVRVCELRRKHQRNDTVLELCVCYNNLYMITNFLYLLFMLTIYFEPLLEE